MRAYVLTADGPRWEQREPPSLDAEDCLVRVRACALNHVDLAMARGHVHGRAGGVGAVLGVEWAGEVLEVGGAVESLAPGARVMGSGAGAFAELAVADSGRVLPVPEGMSWEEAASLPVALLTMHDALLTNGRMQSGDAVLVLGASSGVGLMALRIARVLGAGWVGGSSRDPRRRQRLLEHGADLALDPGSSEWVRQVLDATGGRGVDVVIDQVAGTSFNDTMRATRVGGRIVNVGRLGGQRADFDFDLHALRRLHYIGVTFRTRSRAEVREIARRVHVDLWEHLVAGELRLPIDSVHPFDDLEAALERMRSNQHFGKIVLRL